MKPHARNICRCSTTVGAAIEPNDVILTNLKMSHCFNPIPQPISFLSGTPYANCKSRKQWAQQQLIEKTKKWVNISICWIITILCPGIKLVKQIGKKIQDTTCEKLSIFFLFQSISMAIQQGIVRNVIESHCFAFLSFRLWLRKHKAKAQRYILTGSSLVTTDYPVLSYGGAQS